MQTFSGNPSKWTNEELSWILPYTNAQVLGLGEAVHTSDGFYSAKVRLIQYLVEHHNYRAISFESSWGKALRATHFVESGKGSVDNALTGLFRVWRAKSVASLLTWLREWNVKHPKDPVRFFGNDTQQPEWDLNCLLISPLLNQTQKDNLRAMFVQMFDSGVFVEGFNGSEYFKNLLKNGFAEGQDITNEIVDFLKGLSLEKSSYEYVARMSLLSFVLDTSKNVHGFSKDIVKLRGEAFAHRDECMSDLTLHFAGKDKTVLWAHNYHVSRPSETIAEGLYYQGQFLKNALGNAYKTIGITAGKIEINWPWLPNHQRGPIVAEDSLEKVFTDRFPNQSIFLKSIGTADCKTYCEQFTFEHDKDISARFDGMIILPESGPIEYATPIDF